MWRVLEDNKSYTIKSIADAWNVSKTTINRYISELDAEYLKQHTHTARNRTIIDAEMYQRLYNIYHSEPQQTETEKPQQVETSQQTETGKLQQIETILQHFETSKHESETLLKQIETLYQSRINDLKSDIEKLNEQLEKRNSDIQNLKQEYISQLTVKDNQIKELQKLLDQEQQLHKQTKDQYQLLLVDKEELERKGFFKRLFKK